MVQAKPYTPRPHQLIGHRFQMSLRYTGLLMDMGLGKTIVTLTTITELFKRGEIKKVLVIGPKRVCESVWRQEAAKWQHTKHLTFSAVLGTEIQRKKALKAEAQIYLINVENVAWLVAQYGGQLVPFDMCVIDEFSKFKNPDSKRFKAIRQIRPAMKRLTGLTGTPAPNGLLDLWGQIYLLDRGERLGRTIGEYRSKYFFVDKKIYGQHDVYALRGRRAEDLNELLGEDFYAKEIYNKISDICLSMKTEDYLELPPLIVNDVEVSFSKKDFDKYYQFEEELVLNIADTEITAANATALMTKLRQYSNGAVYDEAKNTHHVHDLKLEALDDIIDEAQGKPVLVFYQFKSDLQRILERYKGKAVELKTDKHVQAWNRGEIAILVTHAASAGHGLNLQFGGNILVWFGPTWNLEEYEQAYKRLHRDGQQAAVVIMHRIIIPGTVDDDIISSLERKSKGQSALMDALKARIEKYLPHLSK